MSIGFLNSGSRSELDLEKKEEEETSSIWYDAESVLLHEYVEIRRSKKVLSAQDFQKRVRKSRISANLSSLVMNDDNIRDFFFEKKDIEFKDFLKWKILIVSIINFWIN